MKELKKKWLQKRSILHKASNIVLRFQLISWQTDGSPCYHKKNPWYHSDKIPRQGLCPTGTLYCSSGLFLTVAITICVVCHFFGNTFSNKNCKYKHDTKIKHFIKGTACRFLHLIATLIGIIDDGSEIFLSADRK